MKKGCVASVASIGNIPDCTCHASCTLCGYREDPLPDTENDCVTCSDPDMIAHLDYGKNSGKCEPKGTPAKKAEQ
jgi:hypothetical protein